MPHAVNFGKRERLSFAKSPEIMNLPNLIEIQKLSYHEFLQADVDDDKRKDESLQAVFNEIFPITDFSETSSLEFVSGLICPTVYRLDMKTQKTLTISYM